MCGTVKIPKDIAPTLQAAIDKVNLDNDNIALPVESSYVDCSFCATTMDVDDVRSCYNNGAEDEADDEADPVEKDDLNGVSPADAEEVAGTQMYTFQYRYHSEESVRLAKESIGANSLMDLKEILSLQGFDEELHEGPDEEPFVFFINPRIEVGEEKKSLTFRQFCYSLPKEEPMYFEFKDYSIRKELIKHGSAKIITQGKRAVTAILSKNNVLTFHNKLSGKDIVTQVCLPDRDPDTVELAIVDAQRGFFDSLYSVHKEARTGYYSYVSKKDKMFFATFEGAFRYYYLSILNDKHKNKDSWWQLLEYTKEREEDCFGYNVIEM